ncbi:MAG: GtrA family protein [Lachnospiraceae bacterium]|nr:GtrA family protein [Lachnospiraceae bacterium]
MLQCRETWYLSEWKCSVSARSGIICKDGGHVVKKIIALCKQYREIIVYLIVGVLTTIVSWAAYAVCKLFLDVQDPIQMDVAVVIRWTTGVVFAYFTNRAYVFQSKNPNMFKEAISFTSSRLVTLALELIIMQVLPFAFGMNDWLATFIAAVVVTVTNYIFSKFIVFKKKKEDS